MAGAAHVAEAVAMGVTRPAPHSCPQCRERGSPHGMLVYPVDGAYPAIPCRYHRPPWPLLERSPWFDEMGNRLRKTPVYVIEKENE